jgi:glycosyltransferase involved in cell wall biosynthesis
MPLTLGTEELVAEAAGTRSGVTELLEPPVDTRTNRPGAADGTAFRREHGIPDDCCLFVVVSRLVGWLKQEGIERSIEAIGRTAADAPVRLVVVGDGTSAAHLRALGAAVNARTGAETVHFTGALVDPRAAYDAADVVIGMGGSALRGMAFGKPLLVIGEGGFSEIFRAESASRFYWTGYYGIGDGDPDERELEVRIRTLLDDPALRRELGEYALGVVEGRYSLDAVGTGLDALYQRTVERVPAKATVAKELARVTGVRAGGAARDATRGAVKRARRHSPQPTRT